MKVRDLDNVIDALTPIWVNYGEYFGERFESYEVMRKETNDTKLVKTTIYQN